ncbi:putative RNA methylase [Klosneuvirus KNV1]|uniref:Putative RNA methylase n=1 Tax=Klosneuvirus KNV1 TaxID=1977640 RepID=A0A1V0SJL0_9VIRU|nr:putative RNA methylase [Klosneuvirus KNV1]
MEQNINNSKVKNIKMILRLFPYLENKELGEKLLIDDDSVHYISVREYAEKISKIIKTHMEELGIDQDEIIVTDVTAGVGGDTISFAKSFNYVHAIEIDNTRVEYLKNNIAVYNCNNVTVYNNNCLNIVPLIENHNVIFIDPPWGGVDYKKYTDLRLSIDTEPIENICLKWMDPLFLKTIPKIIVFKLPKNYDIAHFYKTMKDKRLYYYDLKKMIILVIVI